MILEQGAPLLALSALLLCLQVAIVSQEPILFAERCAVGSPQSVQRTETGCPQKSLTPRLCLQHSEQHFLCSTIACEGYARAGVSRALPACQRLALCDAM